MFRKNLNRINLRRPNLFGVAAALVVVLLAFTSGESAAGPLSLILESDENESSGEEVFQLKYDTISDLVSHSDFILSTSALDLGPVFGVAGFAHDGTNYHLLLESDIDENPGSEVYLITFATLEDLVNNTTLSAGYTQLDPGSSYSIRGLAHDGSQFHMLIETDLDGISNTEVFHYAYDSMSDLQSNTFSSLSGSALNVAPSFSIAGFAHEDGRFHLLLESETDQTSGAEIFYLEYSTINDLIAETPSSSTFTQIEINPSFSVHGFAGISVPEPELRLLLGGGVLGLSLLFRRRDHRNS